MSLRDKHHLCPSFIFSHNLAQAFAHSGASVQRSVTCARGICLGHTWKIVQIRTFMNPLPDEAILFSLSRRDNMLVDTKESTNFDRAVRYGICMVRGLLKNIWRTYGTRLFICLPISTDRPSLRDRHRLCPSFIFSHNLAQVFSAASLVTEGKTWPEIHFLLPAK